MGSTFPNRKGELLLASISTLPSENTVIFPASFGSWNRSCLSNLMALSASSSAAAIRQADDQAMAYVGTWKTDKLTLQSKTNDSDKETDLDVPVALELNDNMTGTLTVGENTQNVEWEVRYWESLKIERAVISLHEPFELSGIVCDTENLMLEFANTENSARLFNHWTSSAQSGVKLGVDMTVEKVS